MHALYVVICSYVYIHIKYSAEQKLLPTDFADRFLVANNRYLYT